MPFFSTILIVNDNKPVVESGKGQFLETRKIIFDLQDCVEEKKIESLVFQIRQNPKNLLLHLQRIFACYRSGQSERLYAALVDFLTVLCGRGRSLAFRVVQGSASGMSAEQLSNLKRYLNDPANHRSLENGFTVLTRGLVGSDVVVEKNETVKIERDYLALAHDFIEYSQIDEAIDILEQALIETHFRKDVQEQLLELYRLTDREARFRTNYVSALEKKIDLIGEWEVLDRHFSGREK